MNNDFVKIQEIRYVKPLIKYDYLYDDDYNLIKEISRHDKRAVDFFYINGVIVEERISCSNDILFSSFYKYDDNKNLVKIESTDYCIPTQIYEYDDKNRETKEINIFNGVSTVRNQNIYGDNGKISRVIYGENDIGIYTYDDKDRVIMYDRPAIENIKYKYDIRDNCIEKIYHDSIWYLEYDEFNNHIATRVKRHSGDIKLVAEYKYKRKEDK